MTHRIRKLAAVALATAACGTASAADLPSLNLGFTSFLDGLPPAGSGWYATQYLEYYSASRINDNAGNRVALPRQSVDVFAGLSQLVYQAPVKVGGFHPGLDVIVPWVAAAHTDDGLNNMALNGRAGFGDLVIGPFLQSDPLMGASGPRFAQRVELQFIVPTGAYDPSRAINPGSHFWSFDPYWAATVWLTPKWTFSWRLHYLWNSSNHEPATALGPDVTSTQAGQAVHANFATEYELRPGLRIGLNGYWLRQITDMKANGQDVSGTREGVWAIGPGAMVSFSPQDHLMCNAYFERDARNRPQGTRAILRYVHHFD
ncbi:SphA family protein [Burkholderia glumae]|uniref:SphA family protein n=1 Tax=Burkholderia glumae TaxID=337 RepID=UPI00146378FC|nr:transporter [Burkholderia glumae]MCM2551475.1 transporter [Burkholderia glumae]NVE25578.1 transporter [Burkholderia glumae]QJP69532.1 phenol degradation protein meta [Burkholderia glumae]